MGTRRIRPAQLTVAALLTAAVLAVPPPAAAAEERGTVTFRLVIEGPIDTDDAFWLRRATDQCCFIDAAVSFCGPPAPPPSIIAPCDGRRFEFRYEDQFAVGTTISYTFLRVADADDGSTSARDGEALLAGEVVIGASPQLITLTYQYPDPNAPILLPDTALAPALPTAIARASAFVPR